MELFRKLALTGLIIFIKPGSAAQLAMGCIISLFFTVMYAKLVPYSDPDDDMLQLLCNLVIFANFFFGLLLKMEVGENDDTFTQIVFVMQLVPLVLGCIIIFYVSFFRYWLLTRKLEGLRRTSIIVKHRELLEKVGVSVKEWRNVKSHGEKDIKSAVGEVQRNKLHGRLDKALRSGRQEVCTQLKKLRDEVGHEIVAVMLEQQRLPVREPTGGTWVDKTYRNICEDDVLGKAAFARFVRDGVLPDDCDSRSGKLVRQYSGGTRGQINAWQRDSDSLGEAPPLERERLEDTLGECDTGGHALVSVPPTSAGEC
jgi:hypothetical protein